MKEAREPSPAELGILIKATQAVLNQRMDEALRPLGLTVAQYASLRNLHIEPGITSSDLARQSFVSRQSMNVLLQGLEKAGLVARSKDAGHRREKATHLTGKAEELLAEAESKIQEVTNRMTSSLDTKQRSDLFALLEACGAALVEE
ncbi:MarR family transcriptional regulator [Actinomycetaceae bacterium L2_0104]